MMVRVKILQTGRIEEHDSGYAARLMEQGKAVPAPPPAKAETQERGGRKAAASPDPAEKKGSGSGEG